MNRQTKRQMAKQGTDKPRAPERSAGRRQPAGASAPARGSTSARSGRAEKVAWPTAHEVINSTIIVLIAVVVMTALIFGFDYAVGASRRSSSSS